MRLADTGIPKKNTFSRRFKKPSSCKLSSCGRWIEDWKAKPNWSMILIAGSREDRIAVCRRRLFLSEICAPRGRSSASPEVSDQRSISARLSSTAFNAPGSFRSASISRMWSRLTALIVQPAYTRSAAGAALRSGSSASWQLLLSHRAAEDMALRQRF